MCLNCFPSGVLDGCQTNTTGINFIFCDLSYCPRERLRVSSDSKIPETNMMLYTEHTTTFNKQLLQLGQWGRAWTKPQMCSWIFKQTQLWFTIHLHDNSTSTLLCGISAQTAQGKSNELLPSSHKPTKELTLEPFKRCVMTKVSLCSCKSRASKASSWDLECLSHGHAANTGLEYYSRKHSCDLSV